MKIQKSPSDPLSDVLSLLGAKAACTVRLEAGGQWAMRFAPTDLKFNAVRRGVCWLLAEGQSPRRLTAGSCFVARAPFVLASDPAVEPIDASLVFRGGLTGRYGEGHDVDVLGGAVSFSQPGPVNLVELLPPVLVVEATTQARIAWLLDELDREWRANTAGGLAVCNDLLRLMFVHALRSHIETGQAAGAGWLAGLQDPAVALALKAIHGAPLHPWKLGELAAVAGLSRSGFAERFRQRTGQSPVDYATRWRMQLAAIRLVNETTSVSSIAQSLGFLSDSAFGAAFRRVHGVSPGRYRTNQRAA